MLKKIAVKRSDGGVSILIPTHEATPELLLRDALATPGYVSHREVEDDAIPSDRIFRDAWTDDFPTETIDIHIERAKEIKLNQFRQLRTPLFNKLDIEFQRALEESNEEAKQEVIEKKQVLRDVTAVQLPETIDELKSFLPECLTP